MPEPPDGAYVLRGPGAYQLLRRDDTAVADARRDGLWPDLPADVRWWDEADRDGRPPLTWLEVLTWQPVVRLYTQDELDQAIADGGYEDIGEHRIALSTGVCVLHGELYRIPHVVDRLREREGGQSGG
jgi:hypothetical protein